jgi:hypothetical protein
MSNVSKEVLREKLKKFFADRNMSNPTLQDQQTVAASWGMKKKFVEMAKEDKAKAQNTQTLADRERRNQKFSEFQLRLAADYAKRNRLEVDGRNQEVIVHLAQSEYDQQVHEAKVAREAGKMMQEAYERDEAARWKKLLSLPYPAGGVGKDIMNWPLERLDDATIGYYDTGFKLAELRELIKVAITLAEVELYPVVFDRNQRSAMADFMTAQVPPLSPYEAGNWIAVYKILELEGASEELPKVKIDLSVPEPPPLPERNDGPRNPHKPGTEDHFQWDREQVLKGIDAQWDSQLGPYLQEISDASGKTIPASLANAVRDDLIAKNLPFTRYNIRRSFAYLRSNEIPANVYSQDELNQFGKDRAEELMSAEDYKKLNFRRRA